jgi:AcrR family transcriptional regulator
MVRVSAPDRIDQLLECAARVFAERGYARTQMADVARGMGVSQGTLYNYVKSKEALFALLVDPSLARRDPDGELELPIATPERGEVVRALRQRLKQTTVLPALARALERSIAGDPVAELATVVGELYDVVSATWRAAAAIERSALDEPELARVYFIEMRRSIVARTTAYLERRIGSGQFREVPDPATAARLIIETVTWFARHRHGDPDSAMIDDHTARATVIDFIAGSLVKRDG